MRIWYKLSLVIIILFFFIFPWWARGAVLYLDPPEVEVQPGDIFVEKIKIDTQGENINLIAADLKYPLDILSVLNFNLGDSIVNLWIKPLTIDRKSGTISLIGGIPGGYSGKISGDPGESDCLGKIIFEVPGLIVKKNDSLPEIKFLPDSQVLLNDGRGTKANLILKGAKIKIVSKRKAKLKNEWKDEIKKDTLPPEDFKIILSRDSNIFQNKYFIVFSALDKQTGIDHYEVKEGKGDWQRAESPYLLKDQNLKSIIKVKAIDKAGNEKVEIFNPQKSSNRREGEVNRQKNAFSTFSLLLIGILIIVLVGVLIKRVRA